MEPCEYWDEDGCYCVCGSMCSCVHGYDPDFVKRVLEADAAPNEAGFDNIDDLLAYLNKD